MFQETEVAVFTTPERCDVFRAAVGDGADYHVDPYESLPLDIMLDNLYIGGARIVVLDEAHFFGIEQLAQGLGDYLDNPKNKRRCLRPIIVCSDRREGDVWLSHFVSYLGVYDIVYGACGTDIVAPLVALLDNPNERVDVVELFASEGELESPRLQEADTAGVTASTDVHELLHNGLRIQVKVDIAPAE